MYIMYVRIPPIPNVFQYIEKPQLDDCYICLDQICDKLGTAAVVPYKCRHPICVKCLIKADADIISFSKLSVCGICRAKPNRYITECRQLCRVPYSSSQSIFVPTDTINDNTLYRDHIQHIIAHSF